LLFKTISVFFVDFHLGMSVKELFKSIIFFVWAQIFWHSRISLFPNGQPATKVAWLSSPKGLEPAQFSAQSILH
jgi:hypothetical protein